MISDDIVLSQKREQYMKLIKIKQLYLKKTKQNKTIPMYLKFRFSC